MRLLLALGPVAVVASGSVVAGPPQRRAWAIRVEEAVESLDAWQ